MAFCEQCGAKLEAGMRFCESCGAPVSIEECAAKDYSAPASQDESMTLFSEADWTVKWMKAAASCADTELGILMTRGSALAEQLGVSVDEIRGVLSSYIAAMKKHGVGYYYLDLDDCPFYKGSGDVESTVGALRLIVDVALPKYLFIIGNEDIIDVARWENRAEDTDGSVESDLCYATLDVNSPWDGQAYNFGEVLRVGRFPTCAGESIEEFKHYFNATPQCTERLGELTPYGLSALVWEDESNDEYRAISHKTVDVSPNVTKESVGHTIPVDANLMFFNLHGSNDTRYWYGQDGGEYPEAFFPDILLNRTTPYLIGVEACYGARYVGNIPKSESIVLTALRNNCLAFLGSSRIAFGTSEPEGSCADVVIGEYIKYLAKGYSAGDSYLEGLKALTHDRAAMDDSDVKTLAEFALYGDPSVRMNARRLEGLEKKFSKGIGTPKGLSVPMPDVRKAVGMAIAEVDAKIEAIVDEYFSKNMLSQLAHEMSDVRQSVYKMRNTGLNQKVYVAHVNGLPRVAKVYFDDRGTIKKALISK